MSMGPNAHDLRRVITEILDDTGLPRHLQVGRILEAFEDHLLGHFLEMPEDSPEETLGPVARAPKKKRAKRKQA